MVCILWSFNICFMFILSKYLTAVLVVDEGKSNTIYEFNGIAGVGKSHNFEKLASKFKVYDMNSLITYNLLLKTLVLTFLYQLLFIKIKNISIVGQIFKKIMLFLSIEKLPCTHSYIVEEGLIHFFCAYFPNYGFRSSFCVKLHNYFITLFFNYPRLKHVVVWELFLDVDQIYFQRTLRGRNYSDLNITRPEIELGMKQFDGLNDFVINKLYKCSKVNYIQDKNE